MAGMVFGKRLHACGSILQAAAFLIVTIQITLVLLVCYLQKYLSYLFDIESICGILMDNMERIEVNG